MSGLHVCTTCAHYPPRPKIALEPVGQELQMVVSSHVCVALGTEPESSIRAGTSLNTSL